MVTTDCYSTSAPVDPGCSLFWEPSDADTLCNDLATLADAAREGGDEEIEVEGYDWSGAIFIGLSGNS